MLQSLRDNMKGTVAVIVIAIFAVPMVLIGIEKLFLGSGGSDAATVGGTSITRTELSRAIYLQKQRILSETDVDPSSDLLKDENLRGPVLQGLIRQAALLNAASEGGLAVAEMALWQQIMQQPQFQTDGVFNQDRFRQLVGNMGYTTATYLKALSEGVILSQQNSGVTSSSFLTEQEIRQFVALAQQTRSYFSVTLSKSKVEDSVSVSDAEIADFYEKNKNQFSVPEQVALNYIEIDAETLAQRQDIDESDVRAQYEQEIALFDAQPQYQVAHILIEDGEDAAGQIEKAQAALASGEDFAEVAKVYSDDLGTRDNGGFLGKVIADAFPAPFVEAVQGLEEGEVSAPVQTEAGTHLIKVEEKRVSAAPTFAERKAGIAESLRRSLAEQELAGLAEQLDELTYSASDLQEAAEALELEVKTTPLFSRIGGEGLASFPAVQQAAFSEDVLKEGHNSAVLELPQNRLVVIRITEHEAERIKPLTEVMETVQTQVFATKVSEALGTLASEVKGQIAQGVQPAELAQTRGLTFKEQSDVSRSDVEIDRAILRQLFSMPRPSAEEAALEQFPLPNGDYLVLGLTDVKAGSMDSVEEAQLSAMRAQLAGQTGNFEASIYENFIVSSATVETD